MAKKKLQIFISSTYIDLIDERQAAVEAILGSKHITAGMELFRAGNTSQLDTIKRWIDESDIYMLILGGRYGSIESNSGKSYTHIEYEYALDKGIPVFAVVLSDEFLHKKAALRSYEVFEKENKDKYLEFKKLVESKIIKYVDDCKDIKIAIKDSISELEEEYELVGWVRSNEGDTGQLLQQLNDTRLECDKLRSELAECKRSIVENNTIETFASGEEKTELRYVYMNIEDRYIEDIYLESSEIRYSGGNVYTIEFSWNQIFMLVAKHIFKEGYISRYDVNRIFRNEIIKKNDVDCQAILSEDDTIRILVQLEKLDLIINSKSNPKLFNFTRRGQGEFQNSLIERRK